MAGELERARQAARYWDRPPRAVHRDETRPVARARVGSLRAYADQLERELAALPPDDIRDHLLTVNQWEYWKLATAHERHRLVEHAVARALRAGDVDNRGVRAYLRALLDGMCRSDTPEARTKARQGWLAIMQACIPDERRRKDQVDAVACARAYDDAVAAVKELPRRDLETTLAQRFPSWRKVDREAVQRANLRGRGAAEIRTAVARALGLSEATMRDKIAEGRRLLRERTLLAALEERARNGRERYREWLAAR